MAIQIVVENGTPVPGANSYVSISEAREYAMNRGVVYVGNDDEVASMLIRATDYLESLATKYQGVRTFEYQALQWPRTGVLIYGQALPPTSIPKTLVNAQCKLAMLIHEGIDLQPTITAESFVTRRKIGPLDTEFAAPTADTVLPTFTAVDDMLAPLFMRDAAFGFRTIRV